MVKVTDKKELAWAWFGMVHRHPDIKFYPPGHNFAFFKLDIKNIFTLDYYGGPTKHLNVTEYLNYTPKWWGVFGVVILLITPRARIVGGQWPCDYTMLGSKQTIHYLFTLYGLITEPLSAYFSRALYNLTWETRVAWETMLPCLLTWITTIWKGLIIPILSGEFIL